MQQGYKMNEIFSWQLYVHMLSHYLFVCKIYLIYEIGYVLIHMMSKFSDNSVLYREMYAIA